VALTVEILEATRVPVTTEALVLRMGVPAEHLVRELERLERRGYLRRSTCAVGTYEPGPLPPEACARCSLRSTCAATSTTTWVAFEVH
jgi:hypothetical protein